MVGPVAKTGDESPPLTASPLDSAHRSVALCVPSLFTDTQPMLTRRIDAALDALAACRSRLPGLRDVFRPGAPERAALDDLLAALERTDAVIGSRPRIRPPEPPC